MSSSTTSDMCSAEKIAMSKKLNENGVSLLFSAYIKELIKYKEMRWDCGEYTTEFIISGSFLMTVGGHIGDVIQGFDPDYDDWQWHPDTHGNAPPLFQEISDRFDDDDHWELDGQGGVEYLIKDWAVKLNKMTKNWDLKLQISREEQVECELTGNEYKKSDCYYNSDLDIYIHEDVYNSFCSCAR